MGPTSYRTPPDAKPATSLSQRLSVSRPVQALQR
jgi:hypothetical protein